MTNLSPDASRFLAQSQSRISNFGRPEGGNNFTTDGRPAAPDERQRPQNGIRGSRAFLRAPLGNPYLSGVSQYNYPFASRVSQAAPLFYSAADDREDDEEREREAEDQLALQASRRLFATRRMEESSDAEDDDDDDAGSLEYGRGDGRGLDGQGFGRGRGIRSSWKGEQKADRAKRKQPEAVKEGELLQFRSAADSVNPGEGSRMEDVGLESTNLDDPPEEIMMERTHSATRAFQRPRNDDDEEEDYDPDPEAGLRRGMLEQSEVEPRSPAEEEAPLEQPKHDPFWASLYLVSLAAMFATFFLVWLHTSVPSSKKPLGDTIYSVLMSSKHLLAVDTLVAVVVSLLWLAALHSYVKPLVSAMLVGVPIILVSFSLYPFISSFKGSWKGHSAQDVVIRWASLVPLVAAVFWTYLVFQARHSLGKAIAILEFASRVLAANSALLAVGFATLTGVVVWTWLWLGMFTRVFLGGHMSSKNFVIDTGSWWLGIWFVLMYLWTLAIGSAIQRATTAATISQWYFHRNTLPTPTSQRVVQAALTHALTSLFGTICLSTLLALLIRLPLLILPRRLIGFAAMFYYALAPTPIMTLTNPLTLTYAAVHSQPVLSSARALSSLSFLTPATPTTTLSPRAFRPGTNNAAPLLPYRLAKLLLHATRSVMALALGFGAWVSTARTMVLSGAASGVRGSLYAYVVGLIAGAIGWGVLGAMEGVLGGVVDGLVVCWGSEGRNQESGGYCLEARWLFGDDDRP